MSTPVGMRLFFYLSVVTLSVWASGQGETIYEAHCSKCHIKEISRAETLRRLDTLKAPPMIEVSHRLKTHISVQGGDKDIHRGVVIAFVKHYIENPDIMISLCNPGALDRFGAMPSLKGKLTDEAKQAVAEWLYDYYDGREFE